MASVDLNIRGNVAHLVLNRPQARNALNGELLGEFEAALQRIAQTGTARVVYLYGAGDESFCAGADLRELAVLEGLEARTAFFARIGDIIRLMNALPQPIVAKVHGFALAGGCGLVAAADLVVASDEAVFGLPEINIGLVPMVVMAPLSRILSRRVLAHLVLTGERISAARALEIGLVSEVHPKADVDAQSERLVQALAAKSSSALAAAKLALYEVPEGDYSNLLSTLPGIIGELSIGADAREGVSAFLEKRAPQWKDQL